jgi:hypothetical protein
MFFIAIEDSNEHILYILYVFMCGIKDVTIFRCVDGKRERGGRGGGGERKGERQLL